MKQNLSFIFASAIALAAHNASAASIVLWADNFNVADTPNFDGASTAGRLSGTEAANTALASYGQQQGISSNQLLLLPNGNAGVRFGGQTTRYDWAAGSSGTQIIAGGGFTVAFDWTPANNTVIDWVSFQVGTINNDSGNLTNDDYGILFRNNGGTERFDNSANLGAGGSFVANPGGISRSVVISYSFTSFADGSSVNVVSTVDGTEVANDNFTWDGNGGQMHMEMGNLASGTLIDNLVISTVPEPSGLVLLGSSLGVLILLRKRRA
ncbi:MAG: hypothetical protein RLZZ505_435 [Verrucomicrobiota bacterium]|jgi:hypothetical protein